MCFREFELISIPKPAYIHPLVEAYFWIIQLE